MSTSPNTLSEPSEVNPRASKPGHVLGTLWFVVLSLAVYCAPELRNWVESDDVAGPGTMAATLTFGLVSTGEALGVPEVRKTLEEIRGAINAERIVLKKKLADGLTISAPVQSLGAPLVSSQSSPVEAQPSAPVRVRDIGPAPSTGTVIRGTEQPAVSAQANPSAKKRILIVGASSIQHALGKELEAAIKAKTGATVKRFGKAATGLSRPDVLDWPKKLKGLVGAFKPDLVIANFGGNDGQNLPLPNNGRAVYGTDKWNTIYTKRIQDFIGIATTQGAEFVNLGMPVMRSKRFSRKMKKLNGITQKATEAVGGVYLETWDLAADAKGGYRKTVVIKGKTRLMRQADGIHYTRYGGRYVAGRLLKRINDHFAIEAKPPAPSDSIPKTP